LPKNEAAHVIGRQFLRSGTAVAANHRPACRARSLANFISKLAIVLEEADELVDSNLVTAESLASLRAKRSELVKIFVSSLATAKSNR
jgi:four helix bundle protein